MCVESAIDTLIWRKRKGEFGKNESFVTVSATHGEFGEIRRTSGGGRDVGSSGASVRRPTQTAQGLTDGPGRMMDRVVHRLPPASSPTPAPEPSPFRRHRGLLGDARNQAVACSHGRRTGPPPVATAGYRLSTLAREQKSQSDQGLQTTSHFWRRRSHICPDNRRAPWLHS